MKLLIVSSQDFFSDYGGGQVYVKSLVDTFIDMGLDLVILSVSNNRDSLKHYRDRLVYSINENDKDIDECFVALLERVKPNVVHAHGMKYLVAKICNEKKIPCIITVHHAGIFCPAGALLNYHDEICRVRASHQACFPCVLNNTRLGLLAYPFLRVITHEKRIKYGEFLDRIPFIPYITPLGFASLIIDDTINKWRDISRFSTLMIAPSKAIAESMMVNGTKSEKIRIVPHGIVSSKTSQLSAARKNKGPVKFFFVGRINYVKGLHVLLRAFAKLSATLPCELHVIGSSGNSHEERYMMSLKKKYRDDHRMFWYGKIDNDQSREMISMFDIYVHPTICMEVYGLSIAEALMQGKPVIATRCGGAEDQVIDGLNGILVEPNSDKELLAAMSGLAENENFLQKISENASRFVVSMNSHAEVLKEIYESQYSM
jgi:glycosyltransferase involved in cell wall biosynthesis